MHDIVLRSSSTSRESEHQSSTSSHYPVKPATSIEVEIVRSRPEQMKQMRSGDITNKLFEGDCLKWLPLFPKESIDMVLCDLPYGTTQNPWDSQISLNRLWKEYLRVVKKNGAIVLTSQGLFTAKLIMSQWRYFRYKICWIKSKPTNFLSVRYQPLRKHEDICIFYRRQPTFNPQMGNGEPYDKGIRKDQLSGSYGDFVPAHVKSEGQRFPTDVVYFKTAESEGTGEVWHPTQKPVQLGRYLIRTYSKPGDVILDNAFGSGSFLLAAVQEGRNYVGIEKNEQGKLFKKERVDYLDLAACRIRHATDVPKFRPRTRRRRDTLDEFL